MPLHWTAAGSRGRVYVEWRLWTGLWILRGPRSQVGHGPPPSCPCWCAPASSSEIDVCSAVIHNRVHVLLALRSLLSDTVPRSGCGMGSVWNPGLHVSGVQVEVSCCFLRESWGGGNEHLVTFLWKTRFSFLSLQPRACFRRGSASCTLGG